MTNALATRGLRAGLSLIIGLGSLAVLADAPAGVDAPAVFSGPITALTSTSLTVQGIPLNFLPAVQVLGLDTGGLLVTLTPAALTLDETVEVFAEDADGVATADIILVGEGFSLKGEVTALTMGSSGPTQVTLDGIYPVDVSAAVWMTGEDAPAMGRPSDASGSLDVGSEVQLWGIANNGAFVAAFGRIDTGSGQTTMDNGFILNLTTDSAGAVTGFTMTSRGSSATIVLDASTQITGKGSDVSALKAGVHVKVWGTLQSDGTVLASQVVIKGGTRH